MLNFGHANLLQMSQPSQSNSNPNPCASARWWILTAPFTAANLERLLAMPEPIVYVKGQQELGANGGVGTGQRNGPTVQAASGSVQVEQGECMAFLGSDEPEYHHQRRLYERGERRQYHHIQAVLCCKRPVRVTQLRNMLGDWHFEKTRSKAALDYVWKDETRVPGTQFEKGEIPVKRNSKNDWDKVKQLAIEGKLNELDSQIYVCHYRSLKAIAYDHLKPDPMVRTVNVYWGLTGVGKSRTAWQEAGFHAYPKDPRTKFWDGYRGHENVVIDEFRGDIDIAHLLRWFDRYPVNVEVKGSAVVLSAKNIWITSNIDPRKWYPHVDEATLNALLRRLNIVHMLDNMLQ